MKQTTWRRLNQKVLLKHPRLTVYEDDVMLPNGHKTTYLHFDGGEAITIIPIDQTGRILLQREYSYPPNEWLYQFSGGKIDAGETPPQAAHRELAEEAGLAGELTGIGWFYVDNRRRSEKLYVYIARDLVARAGTKDIEEDIESYWVSEAEIDNMVRDGKLVNYSALSAWAFYKAHQSIK